jgi:hypothetical protein
MKTVRRQRKSRQRNERELLAAILERIEALCHHIGVPAPQIVQDLAGVTRRAFMGPLVKSIYANTPLLSQALTTKPRRKTR